MTKTGKINGNLSKKPFGHTGEGTGARNRKIRQISVTELRQQEAELEQTRTLLAATLDANADGVLVVDNQGRTVISNQKFLSLWRLPEAPAGGKNEEILALQLSQINHPETFLAKVRHLQTHWEQDSHDWLVLKDGHVYEVLSRPQRLAGDIVGRIWTFRDITPQRQTESDLRNSDARLRVLLTQIPMGVAEIDLETGRFLTVNQRLGEMLDHTDAEILATDLQTLTHPDDVRLLEEKMHLIRKGDITHFRLETRNLKKKGGMLWADISASLLGRLEDTPRRIIVAVHDISDRKKKEELKEYQTKKMEALHRVGVDLLAELNLSTLLQSITTQAMNLLGGQSCNCYIYRPDTDTLEFAATAGERISYGTGNRSRFEGVPGYVLATDSPILVNDYHSWPLRLKEFDHLPNRSMMATPIRRGAEFLGVIHVLAHTTYSFSETDLELLNLFATQAAIAIRNTQLYRKVEQLSVTDALTNLLNRRGFCQLGQRELDRAQRFNRPMAVLMIDIDNFKQINDTHGHAMGDRVLCSIADCLSQNTRSVDILSRYGGDEFVLILPEISFPVAVKVADRLRLLIASIPIPILAEPDPGPPGTISVTVSIGIAVMSHKGRNLTELLNLADQYLFRAKKLGRNQTEGIDC